MRKPIASLLSLALFTSILAGCGASTPNSVWQPRDISESTKAPSQTGWQPSPFNETSPTTSFASH